MQNLVNFNMLSDKFTMRLLLITPFLFLLSCTVMKTEHHITLDHNISIKVEKEVNDFLDDLYGENDS